jgi:hypothetical protein
MISKNSDPNIYCDYCKHDYRRPDGSFKPKVRSAVIRIDYKQYKGHVARRFLCETCIKNITELPSGYLSLADQLKEAQERWEVRLDV